MDQRGPDCLHDGWELKSCSSRTGQWQQWTGWVLAMAWMAVSRVQTLLLPCLVRDLRWWREGGNRAYEVSAAGLTGDKCGAVSALPLAGRPQHASPCACARRRANQRPIWTTESVVWQWPMTRGFAGGEGGQCRGLARYRCCAVLPLQRAVLAARKTQPPPLGGDMRAFSLTCAAAAALDLPSW